MIKNPEPWIKTYLKKYSNKINLFLPHFEEIKSVSKYILWMRKEKQKVGFALLPRTKVSKIKPYLQHLDYILILTVHPGFYGSKFLPNELKKIVEIKKANPKIKVIVDGGMCPDTIGKAVNAGADYFVSGSFVVKAENPKNAMRELKRTILDTTKK